jgi:uncharacterized membrane protein YeiH
VVFSKEIYAGISLLVALLYLGLEHFGVDHNITLIVAFSVGVTLRLCAIYWKWSLPTFNYTSEEWD